LARSAAGRINTFIVNGKNARVNRCSTNGEYVTFSEMVSEPGNDGALLYFAGDGVDAGPALVHLTGWEREKHVKRGRAAFFPTAIPLQVVRLVPAGNTVSRVVT
jgi:hypothetical protein